MTGAELRRRARAWRNVATSATMARLDPSWVPRPHAGHIILTYKCNLKCGGCPSWQVKDHNDLTADEYRKVFRQLTSLDLVKVLGGEPLVRKAVVQILSDVRDIIDPYVMQLTTNGMLTKRTVEAIRAVAWPGLQLRISVDGLEQTHDKMRGVEGSWKLVTKTVREVAELKDLIYLLPNGNLVRCGMDHEPIGNLREQSFDEIWYGDAMNAYRDKVTNCPGCMQSSVQIMSRVYGGCLTA